MQTLTLPTKKRKKKRKKSPKYNVLLWNDEDHSMAYVVFVLKVVLGCDDARAIQYMLTAHTRGNCILFTGALPLAEELRDKILAAPYDPLMPVDHPKARLIASIEKASEGEE